MRPRLAFASSGSRPSEAPHGAPLRREGFLVGQSVPCASFRRVVCVQFAGFGFPALKPSGTSMETARGLMIAQPIERRSVASAMNALALFANVLLAFACIHGTITN